jgi:hypothetical protein
MDIQKDIIKLFETVKNKYLNYFFYLTYLALPSTTTTIFQIFNCTELDPDNEDGQGTGSYLTADMNISCSSEYYYNGVKYALAMIVVYPIGITLFYGINLYLHRIEIENRENDDTIIPLETTKLNQNDIESIGNINSDITEDNTSSNTPKELSNEVIRLQFLWESYKPNCW